VTKVFSISFSRDPADLRIAHDPIAERIGKITLNHFSESFVSTVIFWDERDYRRHWVDGIARLCGGANSSCLLTNVFRPETANFFTWWLIYRRGLRVLFHQAILFLNQVQGEFLFSRIYDYVPPYRALADDGSPISEWEVDIDQMQEFLSSGRRD
jgi:hypothetical protein